MLWVWGLGVWGLGLTIKLDFIAVGLNKKKGNVIRTLQIVHYVLPSLLTTSNVQFFSAKQNFKYFLALDFEAQCQQGRRIQPQEIVEFPCIMVDAQNFQIIDTFHQYIKVI